MFQQATKNENSDRQQSNDNVVLSKEAEIGQSSRNQLILPFGANKLDQSTQGKSPVDKNPEVSKDWKNAPKPPKEGKVFLVGGGSPVHKSIRKAFLHTVSEASGGKDFKALRLVIIPSASEDFFGKIGANADRQERLRPWTELGVSEIRILNALSPDESMDPNFSKPIASADAVWITGGVQKRLSDLYCATPVENALIELLNRGGVIGGSSAGTAIMCNPMICGGEATPIMERGFPFVDAVIDQHFSQRNREKRLKYAVSGTKDHRSRAIGIGIDEHSAIIWDVKSASIKALPGSIAFYYENELMFPVKETETILSPEAKQVGRE